MQAKGQDEDEPTILESHQKKIRTGSPKHHTIIKATISIAALAMVFASVSAQGLCGGSVVGYGSTYYLCASLFLQTKQTLPSFPSPTAFSCSDSWWWWVTAINFILIPKVLSDVTTTDANSKGCEWYHKIKSVYALAYHLFVELQKLACSVQVWRATSTVTATLIS